MLRECGYFSGAEVLKGWSGCQRARKYSEGAVATEEQKCCNGIVYPIQKVKVTKLGLVLPRKKSRSKPISKQNRSPSMIPY